MTAHTRAAERSGSIDLHLHSTYSDGAHAPAELVRRAAYAGVTTLALTDHDSVKGLAEAEAACAERRIEFIPGTELSVAHQGQDLHLLGYLLDRNHPALLSHLSALCIGRRHRLTEQVLRLRQLGFAISEEEVLQKARSDGAVGRLHVAELLVERGWVATQQQAFRFYLGNGGPAYVEKTTPDVGSSLALLRDAGAIPVLAHPGAYRIDGLLEQLVPLGLMGLEVVHPMHSPSQQEEYRALCARFGLLETGGSDYHGTRPGESNPGSVRVAPEVRDALFAAQARTGRRRDVEIVNRRETRETDAEGR